MMRGVGEDGAEPTGVPSRAAPTRALIVGPYRTRGLARSRRGADAAGIAAQPRLPAARLAEAVKLAAAIDLDVVDAVNLSVNDIRPATFVGSGKAKEFAERVKAEEIGLVVMDCALTPVQQRNLEKELGAKVIDRTALILEIFGERARTSEGALQVEHAHLTHQKGRLVRSWTHLERQRGGFGFLGGPGETQIEADRRQIEERIARSARARRGQAHAGAAPAAEAARHASRHRAGRLHQCRQIDPVQPADDRAGARQGHAVRDARPDGARSIRLPHGESAYLIDTVGFISDLPTSLIAAFRATLEEVLDADLIVHVRDVSHAESEAQRRGCRDRAVGARTRPRNASDSRGPEQGRSARCP